MNGNEMMKLGFSQGVALGEALSVFEAQCAAGVRAGAVRKALKSVAENPSKWEGDAVYGELATMLTPIQNAYIERELAAPWRQWGEDLDANAIAQLTASCRLPVAVAGALMPDAHLGYGLPIGGVLATENAVIPNAVGVDIACRMRLTVLDMPAEALTRDAPRLTKVLERETSFGMNSGFRSDRRDHAVLDEDWTVSPVTKRFAEKAHVQLGSSGSGNHFAEYGTLTLEEPDMGLEPGTYLALLTHSGSRGVGASVAAHYGKLAMDQHPNLPKELRYLAWLELDTDAGREYWDAMQLMGQYAAANHECIHREILRNLGVKPLAFIENHHNFAWKEFHFGKEVVVHRKGATPAGKGVMGVIPGSMNSPGFVVRGKGEAQSMASASHGAGRVMSRTQARNTMTWSSVKKDLAANDVVVLSAGVDEAPGVYKDIHEVMAAQQDLVDVVARFDPKLVKMAPDESRARRKRRR